MVEEKKDDPTKDSLINLAPKKKKAMKAKYIVLTYTQYFVIFAANYSLSVPCDTFSISSQALKR